MPVLDPTMESKSLKGSHYGFSAAKISELGASEYTLVTIIADVSGSVNAFRQDIEDCIKEVIRSCRRSPRADNLMLRFVLFDTQLKEVHGFRPLSQCDVDSYNGSIKIGGMTALYDAACNAVDAGTAYAKDLTDQDFEVNAIVFVITDGADNASTYTMKSVKESLGRAVTSESLESLVSILVGVNVSDPSIVQYLSDFSQTAEFTQYVEIAKADEKTLARLADFISKSVSSQSQALGTGGASQSLSF